MLKEKIKQEEELGNVFFYDAATAKIFEQNQAVKKKIENIRFMR